MSKKERLKYVDLLRIIAIIPVVVCHWTRGLEYAGVTYESKILPDEIFSLYLGGFGVAVFFVLSGISLMYTYEGKLDIKKYFYKRFVGIYPMFWIAWIIAFCYYFVINHGNYYTNAPKWTMIWSFLGLDGYFSTFGANWYLLGEWFLGCLLFLYLLFPILKWGIEKHPVVTGIIIVTVYLVLSIFYKGAIHRNNFFLFRVPEFAFGMYFVKYWKKPNVASGIITLAFLAFMQLFPFHKFLDDETFFFTAVYRNTLVGIATVVCVCWLCSYIKADGFFGLCAKISKYGYAVFLTHHVIITEYTKAFSGQHFGILKNYIAFFILVVITGVASVLLYKLDRKVRGVFSRKPKLQS